MRAGFAAALLLSACAEAAPDPVFHADANPTTLAAWGAVASDGNTLRLGHGVTPYTLAQPLFTDYAHKLRTVWIPDGHAVPAEGSAMDFPVGTVLTKTFYYPVDGKRVLKRPDTQPVRADAPLDLSRHRLIETRVLVHRQDGWEPASYVWNADHTEATLKRTGAVVPLSLQDDQSARDFAYLVPNENQCASCHAPDATAKTLQPLGPRPEQLADPYAEDALPQIVSWKAAGLLSSDMDHPPAWPTSDSDAPIASRARAYLAANCAHCHNPVGPADTSGLDLSFEASGIAIGTCKLPIAAGSGTGGHRYDIHPGKPEDSIMVHRMQSTDPGAMMPELGRSLSHAEGTALVADWIAGMTGDCGAT